MERSAARLLVAILFLFAATGCTNSNPTSAGSQLGLRINVPSGWHVRRFTHPANGIEVANVSLPPLAGSVSDGSLQPSGTSFPPSAVALVVYAGSAASRLLPLPLSESELEEGSCALGPCIESASFMANGRTYVLNAKIGLNAWGTNHKLLEETIHSIAPS